MAGAALALSGFGLLVTGVANAESVPGFSPNPGVVTPASGTADASSSTPSDTPSSTTSTSGPSGSASAPVSSPPPSASAQASQSAPASSASASAPASVPASAPATPPSAGQPPQTGSMTAPPARQTLAETGTDGSTPWLLAGGLTLVAGGVVFRFGPRKTPEHGH